MPPHASTTSTSGGPEAVIAEFYPCGLCDDEYLVIENSGSETISLHNWTVADGEGALRFARSIELGPHARLVVSSNSTSYARAFGCAPDISLDAPEPTLSILRTGTFRLADGGDSMSLIDHNGVEVDFVAYGKRTESSTSWAGEPVPALRKGEVARRCRENGLVTDTDSMSDWLHFREFKYGYTDLPDMTATVGPGDITAFASPDCGLASVVDVIGSARSSLRLCAYELSSTAICSAILSAIASGVSVEVLVDGAPAGGMDEEEIKCLSILALSGATVRVLSGNLSAEVVQHVGPLHAKYMIVDDLRSVVLSENFVDSGLPSDPLSGNRGWGLVVTSSDLAAHLRLVFESDSRPSRADVHDWLDDPRLEPGAVLAEEAAGPVSTGMSGSMTTTSESVVRLLLSPDSSPCEPFLCSLMRSSRRLLVEQFQADLLWKDRWTGETCPSPLICSAEEALEGGAEVSLLLDSVWFNAEGNGDVADHVNSFASSRGLHGEARLMDLSGPVSALHNKGLVSDGRTTLVSSNNWGHSSFARNRELAAVVDSEEVARYFVSVFETDWEPDYEPPVADAGPDAELRVGESVVLDGTGSADNRFVARWQWRLEGEGMLVDHGNKAVFTASHPGEYRVHLLVQDAWGNTDIDSVEVVVSSFSNSAIGPRSRWFLAYSALLGALSSVMGAAAARKLNHRNRSS
ncbi:MAG: lamin tail domain-containing protein [Candidatus Thermoplasmatota archaeon]|nr:lamin tail domain-containing protein [Candidatus Thermoplasmatota archaeon]